MFITFKAAQCLCRLDIFCKHEAAASVIEEEHMSICLSQTLHCTSEFVKDQLFQNYESTPHYDVKPNDVSVRPKFLL